MNIFEQANNIVNVNIDRRKLYGSYHDCNKRIAKIMSLLTDKNITVTDVFYLEIAMKIAREIQTHKEENIVDIIAYFGALNDELNDELNNELKL